MATCAVSCGDIRRRLVAFRAWKAINTKYKQVAFHPRVLPGPRACRPPTPTRPAAWLCNWLWGSLASLYKACVKEVDDIDAGCGDLECDDAHVSDVQVDRYPGAGPGLSVAHYWHDNVNRDDATSSAHASDDKDHLGEDDMCSWHDDLECDNVHVSNDEGYPGVNPDDMFSWHDDLDYDHDSATDEEGRPGADDTCGWHVDLDCTCPVDRTSADLEELEDMYMSRHCVPKSQRRHCRSGVDTL